MNRFLICSVPKVLTDVNHTALLPLMVKSSNSASWTDRCLGVMSVCPVRLRSMGSAILLLSTSSMNRSFLSNAHSPYL